MSETTIILAFLFIVSVIGGNNLVATACALLLFLHIFQLDPIIAFLDKHSLFLGIAFMLLGVFLPIGTGQVTVATIINCLRTRGGLVAIIVGICSAILAARGVDYLKVEPEILVGLIVGSVIGVSFLGGIPNGPLMSAGIVAVILGFFR
ncbi:MAG: DUF441 domain-containing protein [Limnochordia bacterium]|jgi:uncharacterized membrane protein (DUF441 family)